MKIWHHLKRSSYSPRPRYRFSGLSILVLGLFWALVPSSYGQYAGTNAPPPRIGVVDQTQAANNNYAPNPPALPPGTALIGASMESLNDEAKLGNGDRVSYQVVEEQKDPIVLTVSDSGELEVPLAGRVKASGMTCKQLAFELKPLLEKDYFYHATVIIGVETLSTQSRGKVYLMGQVRAQGAIEIPAKDNLTVSKAILLDGGLADFADRRKVKLVRKKPDGTTETTIVDLVEILDHGHAERDPVLKADDLIIVPQRLINF